MQPRINHRRPVVAFAMLIVLAAAVIGNALHAHGPWTGPVADRSLAGREPGRVAGDHARAPGPSVPARTDPGPASAVADASSTGSAVDALTRSIVADARPGSRTRPGPRRSPTVRRTSRPGRRPRRLADRSPRVRRSRRRVVGASPAPAPPVAPRRAPEPAPGHHFRLRRRSLHQRRRQHLRRVHQPPPRRRPSAAPGGGPPGHDHEHGSDHWHAAGYGHAPGQERWWSGRSPGRPGHGRSRRA